MKTKTTRLDDKTAEDIERIAEANRTSEGRVIALAVERLIGEVRETGRLPWPPVELTEEPEATEA